MWRVVLSKIAAGGAVAIAVNVAVDASLEQAERALDREEVGATDVHMQLDEATASHDWGKVWRLIPLASWVEIDVGPAAIALLTGLFWLLFIGQAGLAFSPRISRFWLCSGAVALGALSTWPTLFVAYWQDEMWQIGVGEDGGLTGSLRYFIVGVGLREELIKLAFFLPLLPFVLSRRDELERLVVASCVGLGFAAQENIIYFGGTPSPSTVGRYLTANFWHIGSTGLAGLWLCRAIRWPQRCAGQFLAYFGLIIVGHGVYDALLGTGDYAIISTIVFIGMAYAYFHELREVRRETREIVSLTANFVTGLSLLAAITFVYITAQVGLENAGRMFFPPALATSLMVYVYLREVPESLVER
jgi:RsiW-degrading membrane proteinase PrsW (M82 family)